MHRKQQWAKRVKKERFRKKYLSRMQATRLLQTDSMGFRRLCILKGIYPRAIGRSKQKASGNDKQYYLAKEVKWLVHDQLTQRIDEFKAHEKKMKSATATHNFEKIKTLNAPDRRPQYRLDASIKERYPYFSDAVKDIDDAMSMIALYAFLSPEVKSDSTIDFHHALPTGLHTKANQVVAEWLGFCAKSHSLTRAFISIKGFYYEANVNGQRVMWLMPHEYSHKFPEGVQQYVLITFLEFYCELMRFIMFKLNADLAKEIEAQERADEDNAAADTANFAEGELDGNTKVKTAAELRTDERDRVAKVFAGFVFYVSREVPQKHARFVITACGGRVVDTMGPTVTHCVVDRPQLPMGLERLATVEYVQPQYLFDCLNARVVLPVTGYRLGEDLPPHVSPFTVSITNQASDNAAVEEVKKDHPKVVGYVPERVHEIRKVVDPMYNPVDPTRKADELSDSEDDGPMAAAPDSDDDVALSDDDIAEARRKPEWVDEGVAERPERTKMSAFKVAKQRELNLLNQPTSDSRAASRTIRAKAVESKRLGESADVRKARKLRIAAKEEAAETKMKLQVARKKAAKYYKMVNSAVITSEKHEKILKTKAQALRKGTATAEDGGKTFASKKQQRQKEQLVKKVGAAKAAAVEKKAANPYKKLPKWVQ